MSDEYGHFFGTHAGVSIDLDAGQVLALAWHKVQTHGGDYLTTVRDILDALDCLRERFRSAPDCGRPEQ